MVHTSVERVTPSRMGSFMWAVFLICCAVSCTNGDSEAVDSSGMLVADDQQREHNLSESALLSEDKKDQTTYDIKADNKKSIECRGSIQNLNAEYQVVSDSADCDLLHPKIKTSTDPENIPLESSFGIGSTAIEPLELAHEVQLNDQHTGSGEQFIAVRRDSNGDANWCAGCPTDISTTAEGVEELANQAIQHLDRHKPNEKHVLRKILRVQRQAQVVNGVRYILLLEIETSSRETNDVLEVNEITTVNCQIAILEKPWLKLHDGSKFRAVISNNCTEQYNFGDEGEALNVENDTSGDVLKRKYNQNLDTSQKLFESEEPINSERLMEVERQIITEPNESVTDSISDLTSTVMNEPQIVQESIDTIHIDAIYAEQKVDTSLDSAFNTEVNKDSVTTDIPEEKKQVLDGLLGALDFMQLSGKNENDEKIVRKRRSIIKTHKSDDTNPQNLAEFAVLTLDEFDSDNLKRILLKIIDFQKLQKQSSTVYFMKLKVGLSNCIESDINIDDCKLSVGDENIKLCSVEIEVSANDSKKLRKSNCINENNFEQKLKRSSRPKPGGILPIDLPDSDVNDFAELLTNHYDLTSSTDNIHKVVKVYSASKQIVAGVKIRLEFKIRESNCAKLSNEKHECEFLDNANEKWCEGSVWERHWLNEKRLTVKCGLKELNFIVRNKRSTKPNLVGGVSPVNLPDPEMEEYAEDSIKHYDLTSSSSNQHKLIKLISATRQIVSGKQIKLKFEIKESDCEKNVINKADCNVLDGAESKFCVSTIWHKIWLNFKQISINCEHENKIVKRDTSLFDNGMKSITLPNPKVEKLVKMSADHYDLTSSSKHQHKIFSIISAEEQLVSGKLFKILFNLKESDCLKSDEIKTECNYLDDASLKTCISYVWERPWLNKHKISVVCDNEIKNSPNKKFNSLKKLEKDHADEVLFQTFLSTYNRDYLQNEEEYLQRLKIFRNNLNVIEKLNKYEMGTARYAINMFADLTQEEFQKKYLGLKMSLKNENAIPLPHAKIPDITDIPTAYDWRDQGAVTPVKNQGGCGSCWAFSVTGNVEGQYKIKNGNLLSLSEQELVDCDKLDDGCDGGLPDNAYRAIEQLGGLELENDYPYDAADEKCHFNRSLAKVEITGAVNISSDEGDMAKWLIKNGPMSIGINANAMQFYVGGVSHPYKFLCSPKNLDHGVLIVGYGIKNYPIFKKKLPYWIVKNSWGESWGERGYYRVYRGDGTCGLNLMVSSAVL